MSERHPVIVIPEPNRADRDVTVLRILCGTAETVVTHEALWYPPHSGDRKMVAASDDRVWVVWATNRLSAGGTPSWIAEYTVPDLERVCTHWLGLGGARPSTHPLNADVHNQPQVLLDKRGTVHALLGAHNGPLQLIQARKPGTISADVDKPYKTSFNWPRSIGPAPADESKGWRGHTYPAIAYDADADLIHIVSRWSGGPPKRWSLVHQSVHALTGEVSAMQEVYTSPIDAVYHIFYHHLELSAGELTVRAHHHHGRGGRDLTAEARMLFVSADHGQSWRADQ